MRLCTFDFSFDSSIAASSFASTPTTEARYEESFRVWPEVEEELSEDVESQESMFAQMVVRESNDTEENGEDNEPHELNGLATDGVARGNGNPVAGNGASADDDQVSDSSIAEDLIHV